MSSSNIVLERYRLSAAVYITGFHRCSGDVPHCRAVCVLIVESVYPRHIHEIAAGLTGWNIIVGLEIFNDEVLSYQEAPDTSRTYRAVRADLVDTPIVGTDATRQPFRDAVNSSGLTTTKRLINSL